MNIVETNIPDVDMYNISKSKVELANRIIQGIYPLFDEIYSEKVNDLDGLRQILSNKRLKIKDKKEEIETLYEVYKRKGKIKKLLNRISKLSKSGLMYDGSLKSETLMLLKVIESLNNEKLDFHLLETMKTIKKRFFQ